MSSEIKLPKFSGKRRSVETLHVLRYPRVWPIDPHERAKEFDFWHGIAMQILSKNNVSFRLLATISAMLARQFGEVYETDKEIAEMAGPCSTKTISRDLSDYRRIGILGTEYGLRDRNGKMVKGRTIYMSIPPTLPEYVNVKF